ncbi:MAG: hypothetical protein ACM3Q2_06810 [Syntrophothermus sp.]
MELVPIVEITLGIFAGLLTLALAISYMSARLKRKTQNDFQEGNHAKIINLNGNAYKAPVLIRSDIRSFQPQPAYSSPEPEIRPQMRESSPALRKNSGKFTVLNNNFYNKNEAASLLQQEKKNYPSRNSSGAVSMFK